MASPGGGWELTIPERKRILTTHLYGVDLDSQAVEVTKLSLLLKVLEGETAQKLQRELIQERVLPDLGDNIKCGNSLIASDYYTQPGLPEMGTEDHLRINVFDWDGKDGFPEIMQSGGFDAVIGNPPYGYMIPEQEQTYFKNRYESQDFQQDLYLLFMERYSTLTRSNGGLGIIVSNTWLSSLTLRRIRQHMATTYSWDKLLLLPEKVFKATVDTHVLIFTKSTNRGSGMLEVEELQGGKIFHKHSIPDQRIPQNGDVINVSTSPVKQLLFEKIKRESVPLAEVTHVFNGIKPFEKGKGTPPQTQDIADKKPYVIEGACPGAEWQPLLRGSLIHRYRIIWKENYWIKYGPWLAAPRDPKIFSAPKKIYVRQTGDSLIATLVKGGFFARNNLHIILSKDNGLEINYILALINSKILGFAYECINPEKGEGLAEVKKTHIEQLPVRIPNLEMPSEKEAYERIIALVDQILDLNQKRISSHTPHEQTVIERQITAIDSQIDRLVYDLYGLTDEEIKLVEATA